MTVCSLAGVVMYYYFDQNWVYWDLYAANNFRGNIMRYDVVFLSPL